MEQGREMKLDNSKIDFISFTGFGVYGLGYDSWFQSKIYFNINLKNGNFKLTPENKEHRKNPQVGTCLNKLSGKNLNSMGNIEWVKISIDGNWINKTLPQRWSNLS